MSARSGKAKTQLDLYHECLKSSETEHQMPSKMSAKPVRVHIPPKRGSKPRPRKMLKKETPRSESPRVTAKAEPRTTTPDTQSNLDSL